MENPIVYERDLGCCFVPERVCGLTKLWAQTLCPPHPRRGQFTEVCVVWLAAFAYDLCALNSMGPKHGRLSALILGEGPQAVGEGPLLQLTLEHVASSHGTTNRPTLCVSVTDFRKSGTFSAYVFWMWLVWISDLNP